MKKWRVFGDVRAVAFIDVIAKNEMDARELAELQMPMDWTIEEWDRLDTSKPTCLGVPDSDDIKNIPISDDCLDASKLES